jgi:subtilisin family serine protease
MLAWPLCAESDYVIQVAPGTNVGTLASQYQLSVVKTTPTDAGVLGSLSSTQPLSAAALNQLSSAPGVTGLEVDNTVASPEAESTSTAAASLSLLGATLANHNTVDYYGSTVLATYVSQPATGLIRLSKALSSFGSGAGVIAIIDTGVDTSHPALSGVLVPGYDFTRQRPDTVSELNDVSPAVVQALQQSTVEILDSTGIVPLLAQSTVEILDQSTVEILDGQTLPADFGHGTMVAGLVHLVAPQALIMPLKAFNANGTAQLIDIVSAIYYATDHGANVINLSFGYSESSPLLAAAIAYAQSHGVICVASSGNQGVQMVEYPEAYAQVIGVGSTNASNLRSTFSNYGPATNIAAPGEGVITLFPGGTYAAGWGTSFSTALVSGSAALMFGVIPGLTPNLFQAALNQGVPINQGMGSARLQLVNSLTYLLQPH